MKGADCVPEYELNNYHCDCKQGFCGTHCERSGNEGINILTIRNT